MVKRKRPETYGLKLEEVKREKLEVFYLPQRALLAEVQRYERRDLRRCYVNEANCRSFSVEQGYPVRQRCAWTPLLLMDFVTLLEECAKGSVEAVADAEYRVRFGWDADFRPAPLNDAVLTAVQVLYPRAYRVSDHAVEVPVAYTLDQESILPNAADWALYEGRPVAALRVELTLLRVLDRVHPSQRVVLVGDDWPKPGQVDRAAAIDAAAA